MRVFCHGLAQRIRWSERYAPASVIGVGRLPTRHRLSHVTRPNTQVLAAATVDLPGEP